MARVYPFNNGVLMLRNISAPFLNALEDNPWWTLRGCCLENCLPFTGGKIGFCHFHSFQVHEKKRAFLNLLAKKKRPVFEHNSIYICVYIYIDIETFAYIGSFKPRVHCTMFNLFSLCQDPSVFSEPLWHVAHNVLFDCVHLQSQTENVVNSIEVTIYPTTYMQVNQNRKQPDPNPRAFSATCSRPLQQKVTIQWTKLRSLREKISAQRIYKLHVSTWLKRRFFPRVSREYWCRSTI